MKTALITGATGFLGRHLVAQLSQAEPEIHLRLLCRSPWRDDLEKSTEVVLGDITSRSDVDRAVKGVDQIYHLAGIVQRQPKDPSLLYNTHVEGTRHVCEAMHRYGVSKAVFISTSGTIAVGHTPAERDETAKYATRTVEGWPYYTSKIDAEKLALKYVEEKELPIVIVNPSLLLGPGDDRFSSTQDIALFLEGQIMAIPSGGLNLVDVRDVAATIISAMHQGRIGERYLLGGVNWTFKELITHTAQISGLPTPKIEPPLWLALGSAKLLRATMPLIGHEFKLDDESIRMSACFWYCSTAKARKELGLKTRDPMATLRETISYIRFGSR
ncbi:MAG: NAD-dependent epimerase [Solibacterales bacterium]|nr:NAD-dependent epimerase [Bryobacterales bacterium]|tara:strand:+ start:15917 stop:16903 length:987 start_codon:yes stop_codon:yes gene_type:complete